MLAATALPSSSSTPCEEAANLNEAGKKALSNQDLNEAIRLFIEAQKKRPGYKSAQHNLIDAYSTLGKSQTLPAKSMHAFHLADWLNVHWERGPSADLIAAIRALKRRPGSYADRTALAEDALWNGDFAGAVVEFEAALRLRNDVSIRKKLEALNGHLPDVSIIPAPIQANNIDGYMATLQRKIKRCWWPPLDNESAHIIVSWKLKHDGTISNVSLTKSSGRKCVDDAALDAVKDAAPFDQLPSGTPESTNISFNFDYNVFGVNSTIKREIARLEKRKNNPDLVRVLSELARQSEQGNDKETLGERELAILEKALGSTHPDLADCLDHLASIYSDKKKFAAAEKLYLREIAIYDKAPGPDSQESLLWALNGLATVYCNQRKYSDAEPLYRQAIAIKKKIPGETGESTDYLNELADAYYEQKKYADAEPLYNRTIQILEKSKGRYAPMLLAECIYDLAALYRDQGKEDQAEPLYRRGLAIYEKEHGTSHPYVAICLSALAELYAKQRRFAEAELLYKRMLAIEERVYGNDASEVATDIVVLANFFFDQGKYTEAEPLYKRIATDSKKANLNPAIARGITNYATLLRSTNRNVEAEGLEAMSRNQHQSADDEGTDDATENEK